MSKNNGNTAALALLNEALRLEYSIIIHFPRLVNMVKDLRLKKSISVLGNDSIGHADAVASAIRTLGGTPTWAFEAPPEGAGLRKMMEIQLEKEKIAEGIHRRVASLMTDPELKAKFSLMSADEKRHAALAGKILELIP